MCREVEESRSRALEVQADLQALHGDHTKLSEQFDVTQTCNASLRHDLKICKRSLKQVGVQLHSGNYQSKHTFLTLQAAT